MGIDIQRWSKYFVLGLFAMMAGCGGSGGGGSSACSALNAKVFNGETCNQEARSPVVALFPVTSDGNQFNAAGICTGTLITLNRVLTSAHCFTTPIAEFGNRIVAFGAIVGGTNGEGIRVTGLAIHPLYRGAVGSPYDIAVAVLERTPNPPIGPVPLSLSEPTLVGDSVTTFGYGTSNQGEVGVLKAAELSVDGLSAGNLLASISSSGASVCPGDSGGPLVKSIRGVTAMVGVNSFGRGAIEQCSEQGAQLSGFVDIQLPSVLDFIMRNAPDAAAQ